MKPLKCAQALGLFILAVGIVLLGTLAPAAAGTENKPNVLLFLTDDVGLDQLQIYGYGGKTAPPTPNLDALQKVGLTFRNAWTMPACSTSRGVLYTGRYPFRTELQAALGPSDLANSMISPWEKTIPSLMSKAGYSTALFGKFHIALQGNNPYGLGMVNELGWDYFNGWLDETGDPSSIDTTAGLGQKYAGFYPNGYVPGSNVTRGADTGACYSSAGACRRITTLPKARNPAGRQCRDEGGIFVPGALCARRMPANLDFKTLSAHYVSPLVISDRGRTYTVPPKVKAARTYRNIQQTDAAIAWINAQTKSKRPWFATISTATVHTPMQVPPVNTLPADAADANSADLNTTKGTLLVANQMIQAMDGEFGRLLFNTGLAIKRGNHVIPTPALANTVIIYVNDNGSFGPQVRLPFDPTRAKGTGYQTGIWTPMVVAGPLVRTPGEEVDALVNIADLYELIGNIGGIDVRKNNPRRVDSVPMLPYFANISQPSIRKYSFSLVGPNLQAEGGINGPCQFSTSCSQIPVTKGVCEDNGGIWFGEGADASYPTGSSSTPIPTSGFTYCCEAQSWIVSKGGTALPITPTTSIAVRDVNGFKLVRNLTNAYDPGADDTDPPDCKPTTSEELYTVDESTPDPLIDYAVREIPKPYNNEQTEKFAELSNYMDDMLASEPDCLTKGDGDDDGVVNLQDVVNYRNMARLTKGSSWYDVNLDGHTNSSDLQIIAGHLGTKCQ